MLVIRLFVRVECFLKNIVMMEEKHKHAFPKPLQCFYKTITVI